MARRTKQKKTVSQTDRTKTQRGPNNNSQVSEAATQKREETTDPDSKVGSKDGTDAQGAKPDGARSINDPEWYAKYPALLMGAASIPFNQPLGSKFNYDPSNSVVTAGVYGTNLKSNRSIPGICSLQVKPTYGTNGNRNDPLNIAAQQFYTNIRYVNSGRKNYEASDLMMYNMTIAELMSFIGWCSRAYGYAYMYAQQNWYVGKALIEANRIDADDLVGNLANFRYWLNTMITKVSGWVMPNDINMFKRRAYMYSNLYTESTTMSIKDQLYQYIPDGFYKFEIDSNFNWGELKYHNLKDYFGFATETFTLTVNQIIQLGEDLIANIWGDEDFGLMSGDILKAYGSNILGLSVIPEATLIVPVYEEFTLSQMRNATIVPLARDSTAIGIKVNGSNNTWASGDIHQDNVGNLITVEVINSPAGSEWASIPALAPGYITVTNPMPGIDDVIEATRLKCCNRRDTVNDYKFADDSDASAVIMSVGSDVCVRVTLTHYSLNALNQWVTVPAELTNSGVAYPNNYTASVTLAMYAKFHWAPQIYFMSISNTNVVEEIYPVANLDNYTMLSFSNIDKLHTVALLSLLSVPGAAQLVG